MFIGCVGFCHHYWVPIYLISCLVFIPSKSRCSLLGYFSVFITWCLFQANPRWCHISLFNSYSVSQACVPDASPPPWVHCPAPILESKQTSICHSSYLKPTANKPTPNQSPRTVNLQFWITITNCINYNNQTTHTHHHWVPLYWRRGKKRKNTIWKERPAQNQLLSLWKVKTTLLWQVTPPAKRVNDHSKHPKSKYTILQEYNNVIFPPLTQ